jgi:hypothetical protein
MVGINYIDWNPSFIVYGTVPVPGSLGSVTAALDTENFEDAKSNKAGDYATYTFAFSPIETIRGLTTIRVIFPPECDLKNVGSSD